MIVLLQWLKNYLIINRYYVGLFISLFIAVASVSTYKFYIKNYYFVTPSSNELLGLSVIAFLISLYMIYKHYFVEQQSLFSSIISNNVSLYAKVPYFIALVIGIVALIEAIAGETPLYPKHYGTKALWNSIFVSALCCLHLYWLKINLYRNFYTHIITNKLEVAIYTILTIPYIAMIISLAPGGFSQWDNTAQLLEALGIWELNNWHTIFITFILRLFHFFPYETGWYFFKSFLIYIPIVYLFSKIYENGRYFIYLILLYMPIFNCPLFAMPKQSEAGLFTFISMLFLILFIRNKSKAYIVLSLIFLAFATYSRHNQITQVVILIIPIAMMIMKYTTFRRSNLIKFLYVIFAIIVIIEIPSKLIFNNPMLIKISEPSSWNTGSSIAYIAFRQGNLNLIPKKYIDDNIKELYVYYQNRKNYNDFNPVLDSVSPYDVNWKWKGFGFIGMYNETAYWMKLSLDYPGTALEHRYWVFINYLNSNGEINNDIEFYRSTKDTLSIESGLNSILYNRGEAKFNAEFTDNFIANSLYKYVVEPFFSIKYKYAFIIYLFLFIMSFLMLNYKFLPNINTSSKSMCLVYYITTSNIFLFVPLIIATPYGIEKRYLLSTYPLTGLAVLLFLQELPRYLYYYNRCITRFVQKRLSYIN